MITMLTLVALLAAQPAVSTSSTATTASTLAQCEDRVKVLRKGLDDISTKLTDIEDEGDIFDHLPSLMVGTICIGSAAIISEERDWGEPATASLVASCSIIGLVIDLLTTPSSEAKLKEDDGDDKVK